MIVLAALAGGGVTVAAFAGWRERARVRRTHADRVGLMDWPALQFAGLLAAAVAGIAALHR